MNLLLPVTCAILFIQPSGRFLVVHPTGSPSKRHDSLPKGIMDASDISMEFAAARELYEETGICIFDRIEYIKSIGVFPYTEKKNYFLCWYESPVEIDVETLSCSSTFGKDKQPEVDDFKFIFWSDANQWMNPKQHRIISFYKDLELETFS